MGYPPLYHYTCQHGRLGIGDRGEVKPLRMHSPRAAKQLTQHPYAAMLALVIWFTDLDEPARGLLGLTSHSLRCDRTQYRYRVTDPSDVERWLGSPIRRAFTQRARNSLELLGAAMPAHWWVSVEPVPVVFDPILKGETQSGPPRRRGVIDRENPYGVRGNSDER
jgi:hypothetical protein